jgi:hypothetical protein
MAARWRSAAGMRRPALTALLLVLTAAAACGGQDQADRAPAEGGDSVKPRHQAPQQLSQALTSAPLLSQTVDGAQFLDDPDEVSAAAARLRAQEPHPTSARDTFDWGSLAPAWVGDVQAVVEYRTACEWYRVIASDASTHADRVLAAQIVVDIARWPSFRSDPNLEQSAKALAAAGVRGDRLEILNHVLANCSA